LVPLLQPYALSAGEVLRRQTVETLWRLVCSIVKTVFPSRELAQGGLDGKTLRREQMPQHWEEVYEMALLETDQQKLAERIDVALVVLNNSLQEIGDSPEDNCEREWIKDALTTLKTIRRTELKHTPVSN